MWCARLGCVNYSRGAEKKGVTKDQFDVWKSKQDLSKLSENIKTYESLSAKKRHLYREIFERQFKFDKK